ncbi:hypothetical protein C8R45DRAFT_1133057 [Mycena sanguinolenta]|nr:hypothetical protein C8R45DRAFT_1133057 [Mycena sanguinolenta]
MKNIHSEAYSPLIGKEAANEIIRDERMHIAHRLLVIYVAEASPAPRHHPVPVPVAQVSTEAVAIEQEFLTGHALSVILMILLGMYAKLMHQYIELVADRLLVGLSSNKV